MKIKAGAEIAPVVTGGVFTTTAPMTCSVRFPADLPDAPGFATRYNLIWDGEPQPYMRVKSAGTFFDVRQSDLTDEVEPVTQNFVQGALL